MPKNEAETRYELIDPVRRGKGYRLPYIRRDWFHTWGQETGT